VPASSDEIFTVEESARKYFEATRWPRGAACPHCGAGEGRKLLSGLYQCGACRKQFSVTVGTIFQDSNVPLHKWLRAIYLVCSSERGVSAVQLQCDPGFGSYRTAWSLCRRLRWAMQRKPVAGLIRQTGGTTETWGRRPLRIRAPWDQIFGLFLEVRLPARDSVKSERRIGAKMQRRSRSKG
jgi:hypothetical protein